MKKTILMFLLMFLPLGGCVSSMNAAPDLTTPAGVRESCHELGAYNTIRLMNEGDGSAWRNFEARLAAGEDAWLQLVPAVLGGSDAGYTGGIIIALAQALPVNPESVLALEGAMVSMKYVCSIPFIEPSDEFIDSYAASVEKALDGVTDKYFAQDKRMCRLRMQETLKIVEQRRKGEFHFE